MQEMLKKLVRRLLLYQELTKPSIQNLVLVTTALGFFLATKKIEFSWLLLKTLLGAYLVCAGASALNHYLERDSDSKMLRTKNRPIPQGLILPSNALIFGVCLVLAGVFFLYSTVNLLTAFLSLLTAFLYVLVYTPMKKITWLNTTIGAIPGALPPVGGWSAATGQLDYGAWVLFFILFIWQHPHFYAIAWMFKEDYLRGGFKMLPVVKPDGKSTFFQILLFSVILIPASLLPTFMGLSGYFYFSGALILGIALLVISINLSISRSLIDAKKLLKATVIYLPLLLVLIIIDLRG